VIAEGVKEIWLSSEDTGAYGIPRAPSAKFFFSLPQGRHFFLNACSRSVHKAAEVIRACGRDGDNLW
jgi:hypothetical protein